MAYVQLKNGVIAPAEFAERSFGKPDINEIATTRDGRDITRGYVSPMALLTPQDTLLAARGGNYTIYREVLRDDQVKAVFEQRRLAVTSREWEVRPGGDAAQDEAAAEFLREQLHKIKWDSVTDKMLYGGFYGYAVAEMMWGRDGGQVVMNEIRVRDRRRFAFDDEMRLRLLTSSSPQGELLPERKFWAYATGADHDDEPYGMGLAHWLYWPVFFKRNGIKFWLIFLEKFGQPTAKGEYPATATADEKTKLLDAVQAIATDSGVILPQGMAIELIEAARSGTADYTALFDRMNATIAKVVLGQTLTTEAVGGQYKADVQMEVRQDLIKADADMICESFNRGPARWLTEWNFPGAATPQVWRKVDEGENLNELATRTKTIFDMGFRPTLKQITDDFGGEWEDGGRPAAPDTRTRATFAEAPASEARANRDVQQALADGADQLGEQWELLRKRVEDLVALLEETQDLALYRERLAELLDTGPPPAVIEALARAGFAAHVAGRAPPA